MVNLTITEKDTPTGVMGSSSWVCPVRYNGIASFGATEAETTIGGPIPIGIFRQFLLSVIGTAWGSATVTIRVYPCDSGGNKTGNAFFAVAVSGNGTQVVYAQEMGGTVNSATYPATAQTSGVVVGPLGSYLLLTEQSAFTSGTNTVAIELDLKG